MFKTTEEKANWAVIAEPPFRPEYLVGFYRWKLIAFIAYLWHAFCNPQDDVVVYEKQRCEEHKDG